MKVNGPERIVYLDNNATTPCAPEVLEAMLPFFISEHANPASAHVLGRRVRRHVELARQQVASLVGALPPEIVFTSGATESNNLIILGLTRCRAERHKVLRSAVEHKSVLEPCAMLQQFGFTVEEVPVDQAGLLRIDILRQMLDPNTALVSVQLANNEVGMIQPMRQIVDLAHAAGALVHSDAAQAIGKIDCRVDKLDLDIASFSAHKMYGPKGVGALYLRKDLAMRRIGPVFGGGGQELGLRHGTLNVPGIIGMGQACELAGSRLESDTASLSQLRDAFEQGILRAIESTTVVGCGAPRLPGTTNITISSIPADMLITNTSQVCISSGSACTSGAVAPSHVLLAMGLDRDSADCSFRASFGRMNTKEDVDFAIQCISAAVTNIRAGIVSRA